MLLLTVPFAKSLIQVSSVDAIGQLPGDHVKMMSAATEQSHATRSVALMETGVNVNLTFVTLLLGETGRVASLGDVMMKVLPRFVYSM